MKPTDHLERQENPDVVESSLKKIHVHADDEGITGFACMYSNAPCHRSTNLIVGQAENRHILRLGEDEHVVTVIRYFSALSDVLS